MVCFDGLIASGRDETASKASLKEWAGNNFVGNQHVKVLSRLRIRTPHCLIGYLQESGSGVNMNNLFLFAMRG